MAVDRVVVGRLPVAAGALVLAAALQAPGCWCEPPVAEHFNDFPGGGPADAKEFCRARAPKDCAWLERCNPADFQGLGGASRCEDAMTRRCEVDNAERLASVAASRMQYDGYHAQGCLGALNNRACADPEPVSCAQVFAANVAANEPCVTDQECGEGLFCSGGPDACGLCAARFGADGPCWGDSSCQVGLHCEAGRCINLLTSGAVCGADPAHCPPGTACAGPYAPLAVCAVLVAEGYDCSVVPCADGLTCVAGADTRTCRAPAQETEPCDPQGQGAPPCDATGARLYCDAVSRVCAPARVATEGQSCGASAVCRSDLRCRSGTCVARPRSGQACIPSATQDTCFESRCVNGACVTPARAGEPCDGGCPGLMCTGGICGASPCDGGVGWDAWVPVPPDAGQDGGSQAN